MEHPFRSGDVVRYDTLTRPNRWCREGMAVAERRNPYSVVLMDTFWMSGAESHLLTPEEIDTAELLFNVGDYDELDRFSPSSEATWQKYARDDRKVITAQHGLQKRWFIRKGATESLPTQITSARELVAQRESELQSAQHRLDWAREDLDKLLAEPAPSFT